MLPILHYTSHTLLLSYIHIHFHHLIPSTTFPTGQIMLLSMPTVLAPSIFVGLLSTLLLSTHAAPSRRLLPFVAGSDTNIHPNFAGTGARSPSRRLAKTTSRQALGDSSSVDFSNNNTSQYTASVVSVPSASTPYVHLHSVRCAHELRRGQDIPSHHDETGIESSLSSQERRALAHGGKKAAMLGESAMKRPGHR